MRPGQQNKRGRGRGNNNNNNGGSNNGGNFNRKGSNPLTRTYDSSGPDLKIRGTAQHIAEKYAALARDAQSAGDRVMAENYLQHAEHYNRIIAAAQAQMQERFGRDDRPEYGEREHGEREMDDLDAVEMEERAPAPAPKPQPVREVIDGTGPQPVIEGIPAEVAIEEETPAASEQRERPQRRRGAGNRPRRQPRRGANAEGGAEGETEAPETPALADVTSE